MSDHQAGTQQAVAILSAMHNQEGDNPAALVAGYIAASPEDEDAGYLTIIGGLIGVSSFLLALREQENHASVQQTLQLIATRQPGT